MIMGRLKNELARKILLAIKSGRAYSLVPERFEDLRDLRERVEKELKPSPLSLSLGDDSSSSFLQMRKR